MPNLSLTGLQEERYRLICRSPKSEYNLFCILKCKIACDLKHMYSAEFKPGVNPVALVGTVVIYTSNEIPFVKVISADVNVNIKLLFPRP